MPEDKRVEETTEKGDTGLATGGAEDALPVTPDPGEETWARLGGPGCGHEQGGMPPCGGVLDETDEPSGTGAEAGGQQRPSPAQHGQDSGATVQQEWPTTSVRVVGLCFRKGGKVYYFHPGDFPLRLGDFVVVETERGVDIGEVVALKPRLEPGEEEPSRRVLRPATPGDVRRKRSLQRREQEAFKTCERKIAEHGLEMKLIDASYTLDGKRLTFSFVSEGRVDFRNLVRDLAQTFRCRIELRQVGVRDQAKMLGGLGPCGRPLCCATFLRDFCSVGIRLAKDQGLSLNPAKISGACDRLMCCLRYEHAQYVELNKRLPKLGERIERGQVVGEVVARDLLTGAVTLRTPEGKEIRLSERDLFPEGISVPPPAPRRPRPETRRSPERRTRSRREQDRPPEAPTEAAPAEMPATSEAPPAPDAAAGARDKPHEDHRKQGHRHRNPRHRRRHKPGGHPPAAGPAGAGHKPEERQAGGQQPPVPNQKTG